MVANGPALARLFGPLATENGGRLIDRLDGATKAKVLSALAGLVILGFAMMLLAWLGGRAVKRYMNSGPGPRRSRIDSDDWAVQPRIEPPDGEDERTDAVDSD